KELDAQILYYKEEEARLNPSGGAIDELGGLELRLQYQLITIDQQLKNIDNTLKTDEQTIKDSGGIQSDLDRLKLTINNLESQIQSSTTELRNIEVTKRSSGGGYDVNELTPPGPGGQVAPVLFQSLAFGLVLGMLIGGVAVAYLELNDGSFRSPEDIRNRLGVAVIGHIPHLDLEKAPEGDIKLSAEKALVTGHRPKSNDAEAYRGVRTQVYFSTQGRGHQVIQVTSPDKSDGKSTLAANLATAMAQSGKRVILIDCDLRRPQVHKIFGLTEFDQFGKVVLKEDGKPQSPQCGLSEVVAGNAPLAKALRRSEIPNLDLMPAGKRPPNPSELLTSPRLQQLLNDLREQYDFVIVDTPPVLAVSDPANVAPRVDGVIVVFRMTNEARQKAERTVEQLKSLGVKLLGVVVNSSDRKAPRYTANRYGGNYYGYGYGYKHRYYDYTGYDNEKKTRRGVVNNNDDDDSR
ncbi:MAG: polysaccharide biosynthesis tyrosine autokinase, partial [Fimbriiglobus sp.]